MKRFLITFCLACLSVTAFCHDFTYEGVNYTVTDMVSKTCKTDVTVYKENELVIPSVVSDGENEYTVTEIGDESFCYNSNTSYFNSTPQTVRLPNSVTRIGKKAFQKNYGLTEFVFSESLVEIDDSAFYECAKEMIDWVGSVDYDTYDITLPDNVRRIGAGAFQMCRVLRVTNLPAGLEEIGDCAFAGCIIFRNVDIPESVSHIGREAFRDTSIEHVTFPPTLTVIEESTFQDCNCLETVTFPDSLLRIEDRAFMGCLDIESLDFPDGLTWIGDYAFTPQLKGSWFKGKLTSLTLPNSVTHIGEYAFCRNSLRSVALSGGLAEISAGMFEYCENISFIDIPASVEIIRERAFGGCKNLAEVKLSPSGLYVIERSAFGGCGSLASFEFPSTLVSVGDWAFSGCGLLTSISLPAGVVFIKESAFQKCKSLSSVHIPSGVREIGDGAFNRCTSLEKIDVDSGNQWYADIDGVLFDKEITGLHSYPAGKKDKSYVVPATVKEISRLSFAGNSNLESVVLPESVAEIPNYAFSGCSGLSSVTLPENLKIICWNAFEKCGQLTSVDFPEALEEIWAYAFDKCPLRAISLPQSVRKVDSDAINSSTIETLRISGRFELFDSWFVSCNNLMDVYYLTDEPQENGGDILFWFSNDTLQKGTLYVLEPVYDRILTEQLNPWCLFSNIKVYDPSGDPWAPGSVESVSGDDGSDVPVSVYTLNGIKVSAATDNLPSGIYIVRRGASTERIMVK